MREARDMRERRDPKFEDRGSKFRKPRTSDLEPSPDSLVPLVSRGYPARVLLYGARRANIELLACQNIFSKP